jgi:hypothetical protein
MRDSSEKDAGMDRKLWHWFAAPPGRAATAGGVHCQV